MSNDLLITPGSRKQEFKDSDGNIDAKIETDVNGNLVITNPGGDISLGDTTADVFIGDGTNNVDIVFEQNGEIRGTSGVTVTLGDSGSNVSMGTDLNLNGNAIVGVSDLTITGDLNITGDINSYNVTDLDVTDKTITLGVGGTATSNDTGGIIIDGANAKLTWANTAGKWSMNKALQFDDTATATDANLGIYWTGFDKEAVDDFSDTAHIAHVEGTSGGHSILEIASNNDADDTIRFKTHADAVLKHQAGNNTYNVYTTQDFATSDFVETAGANANNVSTALNLTGNINQSGGYFVSNGFQPQDNDLDTAWGHQVTTSKNVGIQPFRYQKHNTGGLNQPTTMTNNANWGLNIYSHSQGNTGLYGLQLTGGDSDNQAMFFRRVSDGAFGNWYRFYSTNDFTWQANAVSADGYVTGPAASDANKVWKTDGSGNPAWRDDANTWVANAVGVDGYVAGPVNDATGQNKVWKTDGSGVPAWRDDADTNTFRTVKVDTNGDGTVNETLGAAEELVLKAGTNVTLAESGGVVTISSDDDDTWIANALSTDGYVSGPTGTDANKVWKTDASGNPAWRDDADTWVANTVDVAGYVAAPSSSDANQVWKTDANGVPAWRNDANTWVANNATTPGYVGSPGQQGNKVWRTNASGSPGWLDELGIPKTGGTFTGDVLFNRTYTAVAGAPSRDSHLLKFKCSAWNTTTEAAESHEIKMYLDAVTGTSTGYIFKIEDTADNDVKLSIDNSGNIVVDNDLTIGGNSLITGGYHGITPDSTGVDSLAQIMFHGSDVQSDVWTADALTAYNATTSYDHNNTDVQRYWARHAGGVITSYMQDNSSGPVLWERFAQLDDANDHATQGMRDMVFYQYDGAGTTIADMKKPDGKLLTIRTYENSGTETQLSLDSDGNLTVPGTVTAGGVSFTGDLTFPAAGTATAYNAIHDSAGSLVFKSSGWDNNDSTAVENLAELKLEAYTTQNNIGYSHLVIYDGDESINKPIAKFYVYNGATSNINQRNKSVDFYGDININPGPSGTGSGALISKGVFTKCQSETATNSNNVQKGFKVSGTTNIGTLDTRDAFIAASGLHAVSTNRTDVFTIYPKPTSSASHYVYQGGASADSVARDHIFQADDSNDNTNAMRDMVFYQYSGTGDTAAAFAKPNGNLLTIRTFEGTSSGHETQLSLNSDGNLTIAGTATIGAYTLPSTGGSTGQVLVYPGSGSELTWADQSGGEDNQNAFSNVAVSGQNTVSADSATDTLTLVAGTDITITTDSGNDTVTINSTGGATDSTKLPLTGGSLTGDLTFPSEGTATSVDPRQNSEGSIIFEGSSWDSNDSVAKPQLCEVKLKSLGSDNIGRSTLTFFNGTSARNEPLVNIGPIEHGSTANNNASRVQAMQVFGDLLMSNKHVANATTSDYRGPEFIAQRISIKPHDEDGGFKDELALEIKGDNVLAGTDFINSLGFATGLPIGSASGSALTGRTSVMSVFPKTTQTEASSYIFAGRTTSESIMREHIFSADNSNDFETTGMRDMLFYEWDGAGLLAGNMVAPTGKLLTVRTHDSATAADQKTHLSVSGDGTVELFDGDYTIKKPADVTIASTSTNATSTVLTLDKTTFTSAEVTIQITDTTPNPDRFEVMKLLIIHNSIDVHFSMSDNIYTNIPLIRPNVTLVSNDINVEISPDVNGSAFTIKTFARIIA